MGEFKDYSILRSTLLIIMCFSANASFGAGIVLSVLSVASIRKVKQPSELAFASIPLIFAIQQFSEGLLWLSITDPIYGSLKQVSTYTFLFFAQIVWPIWLPLALLLLTKNVKAVSIHKIFVLFGVIVSLYLTYCLIYFDVEAKVVGQHIAYLQNYPLALKPYVWVFYGTATVLPAFFSKIKWMWILGMVILISYIITNIFYRDYVVSVWCFFASVISIVVVTFMYQINPAKKSPNKLFH